MLIMVLVAASFGLMALIITKIIEVRKSYVCPKESVIKDYFEGRLKKIDSKLYERVITHFGICEKCQATLEGYVTEGNSKVGIEDHLIDD